MEDSIASCPCQRYRQCSKYDSSTSNRRGGDDLSIPPPLEQKDEESSPPPLFASHRNKKNKNNQNHNHDNHSNDAIFCPKCTHALLHHAISQHKSAFTKRQQKRNECDQVIRSLRSSACSLATMSSIKDKPNTVQVPKSAHQIILQYQQRIEKLTRDIELIRQECSKKSVALASCAVVQSNRSKAIEEQRQGVDQLQSHLDELHKVVPVSLEGTMEYYIRLVQKRRFQLALEAFDMHRMDVGSEYNQLTYHDLLQQENSVQGDNDNGDGDDNDDNSSKRNHHQNHTSAAATTTTTTTTTTTSMESKRFQRLVQQRVPSGIGKIGGLLMPHRGPLHFHGVLPNNILVSSLRMIASLTSLLARCLSIELPHPIVLCPMPMSMSMSMSHSLSERQQQDGHRRLVIVREEDLWLRNQTADIIDDSSVLLESCSRDESKCSFTSNSRHIQDENWNMDKHSHLGITLMKDLDNLDVTNNHTSVVTHDQSIMHHDDNNNNNNNSNETIHAQESLAPKVIRQCPPGTFVKQSTSASSLLSLVGSSSKLISHSARRAFDKMTGHNHNHHHSSQGQQHKNKSKSGDNIVKVAMDGDSIALRVKFASCAIIYESIPGVKNVSNARYELRPPSPTADRNTSDKGQEQFAIGLQLLQNDIVALCIKAGVPISMLWPAEAMCLNLYSLKLFLSQEVDV